LTLMLMVLFGGWAVMVFPPVVRKELQNLKAIPYQRAAEEWKKGEERRWRERALRDRTRLLTLSPYDFEMAVARLYEALGYAVTVTSATNDGGRDLVLESEDGTVILVECKQYAPDRKVGRPQLQKLHSAMVTETGRGGRVGGGIVATTGGFSDPAVSFAREHGIELVDGLALAVLIGETYGPAEADDLGTDMQAMCEVCGALTCFPVVVPREELEQPCSTGCGGSVRHPRERELLRRYLAQRYGPMHSS